MNNIVAHQQGINGSVMDQESNNTDILQLLYFGSNTTQHLTGDIPCNMPAYYHRDFTEIPLVTNTITVFYLLTILTALLGNGLVITTVWRNAKMHTITNYYIVNLAVSDFLVASIVMPLKLLEYTAPCPWQVFASDWACSVVYYLLPIFVFASILTLMAISIERYYAIVHPLSTKELNTKSRTRKIIAATWIIPAIVASPYIYCRSFSFVIESEFGQISRQICNDNFDIIDQKLFGETGNFRKGYFIFLFLLTYVIPASVIVITCFKIANCLLRPVVVTESLLHKEATPRIHEENRRKVARMIITIAIAFILAWSPQYIVVMVSQLQKVSFLRQGNFLFTMLMTHLFGFINSCINPIVYTIMSERFRKSFIAVLACLMRCCSTKKQFLWTKFSRQLSTTVSTSRRHTAMSDVRKINFTKMKYSRNIENTDNSSESVSFRKCVPKLRVNDTVFLNNIRPLLRGTELVFEEVSISNNNMTATFVISEKNN